MILYLVALFSHTQRLRALLMMQRFVNPVVSIRTAPFQTARREPRCASLQYHQDRKATRHSHSRRILGARCGLPARADGGRGCVRGECPEMCVSLIKVQEGKREMRTRKHTLELADFEQHGKCGGSALSSPQEVGFRRYITKHK